MEFSIFGSNINKYFPPVRGVTPEKPSILRLASGLRCAPGDLAIVGGKDAFDENLGCIVEVVGAGYMHEMHGFLWAIRSVGRPLKMYASNGKDMKFALDGYAPDSCLTPIKGTPLDDAEDERFSQENMIPERVH